jgi:hypothetical protein
MELLKDALKMTWPDVTGTIDEDSVTRAVQLKQTLMIAPSDYRIHYCRPGSAFDPAWMAAEVADGFPVRDDDAQSMRVAICLFPALAEQNPVPFPEHIAASDIVVDKKMLFPTIREKQAFDPRKFVAKAVVLVV